MSGVLAMTTNEWETACVGILIPVVAWFLDRRGKRIEVIVNGRYDSLIARTVQLEDRLRELGHVPPPDPAATVVPVSGKE